jgi:hypothetical protein
MGRLFYVKYLVILVYIRGVVIFILYISCICWFIREKFNKGLLGLGFFLFYIIDRGAMRKFIDVGEFMWIYLFFRFIFNILINSYSLNLFKISGSLRF